MTKRKNIKVVIENPTGKKIKEAFNLPVKKAYYSEWGNYYNTPKEFPCALTNHTGWIMFKTRKAFENSKYLHIKKRVNMNGVENISQIPGYREFY